MKRSLKPVLLGAAAAAAVVLAALAGWALFGPTAPPRPAAADATAPAAVPRIVQHAQAVVRETRGMRYVGTEESLERPREGYRVTFAADDPALARARDDAGNAARQAAWQRRFCSEELRKDMAAQRVNVVTGRVVDGAGRTQYVADCVAGGAPQQAGPGGPLL
jgi:hypothetical protein